jgi:hypothetical protein
MTSQSSMSSVDRPRPLLFLHIRKTAGSTVRSLLANRFSVAETLLDWHHVHHRGRDLTQYAFVTGHVTAADIAAFPRPPLVLVFLRRAVERALSAYYFYRDLSPAMLQHFHATLPPTMAVDRERFQRRSSALTLLEFLECESDLARRWLSNTQTRILAGVPDGDPLNISDDELWRRARDNLEQCEIVGLTERMAESLEQLKRCLGWSDFGPIPHLNRTRGRPTQEVIDPAALDRLRRWNQLDEQLYAHAETLFTRRNRSTTQLLPPAVIRPSAKRFSFDQPIHGRGWQPRELFNGQWLCWIGPEPTATLELSLETEAHQPLHFDCWVASYLSQQALDGLRIELNGIPLALIRHAAGQEGVRLTALVSPPITQGDCVPNGGSTSIVRLTFHVPHRQRPCDIDPRSADDRLLGVALREIRIAPIGAEPAARSPD